MPMTVSDLTAEVRESNQRLTAAIESLNVEVAQINVYLAFVRRSIFILVPILVTLLLGGIGTSYKIVWDTARLHVTVENLQQDVGSFKQDVGILKQDVGTLKEGMARLDQKLTAQGSVLSRIEKAVIH